MIYLCTYCIAVERINYDFSDNLFVFVIFFNSNDGYYCGEQFNAIPGALKSFLQLRAAVHWKDLYMYLKKGGIPTISMPLRLGVFDKLSLKIVIPFLFGK